MPRLFLSNFDFEHALAAESAQPNRQPAAAHRPEWAQRFNRELTPLWIAVAEESDRIWAPFDVEESFSRQLADAGFPSVHFVGNPGEIEPHLQITPWGFTQESRDLAARWGCSISAPDAEIIRRANSRRTSWQWEQEWGVGLEFSHFVGSSAELQAALSALPGEECSWIVKAEYGMSGRERFLGTGRHGPPALLKWADKRLQHDRCLIVEQWVRSLAEISLHWTITADRAVTFAGCVELVSSERGQYQASRCCKPQELPTEFRAAYRDSQRAAESLAEEGYFGPLGIDAMLYQDRTERPRVRPLQDINARYTMGRLCLGFARVLPAESCWSWLHRNWPTDESRSVRDWLAAAERRLPRQTRVVRTSPFTIDGQPTRHGTLLLVADCREALLAAEQGLLRAD